ncbi:class I SAM-dependent methyltransferase [Saccharothrix lopnurensis]|uniref:Class I SAM-dependent methyltransferase n=1 Tax=Saccharothrix lopnurensis TaxID=1670621 RepID=A0ABW1P8B5_9PSEU
MPTEQTLPELHQLKDVAGSFGVDPERYDRARPRYPDAAVAAIVATAPGPDVLDVGIGTGIAARQFEAAGSRVLGVDVDPRMAGWARRRGHEVEVAAFEDWDPAGRVFDAVVSGQAWHWVDPVAGAAKAARVLRPGGRLAVFWNVEHPSPEATEAFTAVYRRVLPDSPVVRRPGAAGPEGYELMCDRAADGVRAAGAFDEPERWRFEGERTRTRAEWLDLLPTTGLHTRLPAEVLARVLEGIGAAIDAVGGSVAVRCSTVVVTAARTGAA